MLDVRPFESDDEGDFEADGFGGVDDALGDDVAAHDAAEDVDEDAFDGGVGEDDFEGFGDGFFGGGASDVEEVGGVSAVVLDGVHGGHGEAGAVDEAPDRAVHADIRQVVLLGCNLTRVIPATKQTKGGGRG